MTGLIGKYGSNYKSLLKLAVPIVIGQLGGIITGLADTIMVGQYGTSELAASSFVNNVLNAFIIFGTGFSFALTPLVGENLARDKRYVVSAWLKNGIVANFLLSLVLMAVLTVIYFNIHRFGQPVELLPLIRPYFLISMISVIFIMLSNSFRQFVEGITDPSISMWILISGNLLNIVGNYVLIYGKLGFPEMGLIGAGWSTMFSRIFMFVMFVLVFLFRPSYKAYRKGFKRMWVLPNRLIRITKLGVPIALQQGLEAVTFSLTAIMVGWLTMNTTENMAAHQVVIAISTISFTTYLGLGSATAIRTSFYKGANDWVQVRKTTVAGIHLGLIVSALTCLALYIFRNEISFVFSDNEMVSQIVISLLPILMLYQFVDGAQIVLANALRGLSDVKSIMWISFVTNFLIAIPAGYILGFILDMGIKGIWFAYPIGFVFSVALLGIRAHKLMKRN
ncbi:MAG: MATE family efflux transporter [Bacteroidales bacterium]|nr:MATE family efflux transporter [Bacteroidales bacterium]